MKARKLALLEHSAKTLPKVYRELERARAKNGRLQLRLENQALDLRRAQAIITRLIQSGTRAHDQAFHFLTKLGAYSQRLSNHSKRLSALESIHQFPAPVPTPNHQPLKPLRKAQK